MANPLRFVEKSFVFVWRNMPFLFVGAILLINLKLHTGPRLSDASSTQTDVLHQLAYLERQIHDHQMATRMQRLFPEGFLFTQALYGLTWCELALGNGLTKELEAKALTEARLAFAAIDSKEGRKTFESDMVPPYGMFYNGWRNYLLAKIVAASKGADQEEVKRFTAHSKAVANIFETSTSCFPDSYPEQSWPADACVGMASLALYNRLVAPTYDSLVKNWVMRVNIRRDPPSRLLPHESHTESAMPKGGPRGCSGVLSLYFLPDIDPGFAVDQFSRFDSLFGFSRLGLATVREYPLGEHGFGDVDSGPVFLGVGFSATIVGIGAYLKFGEVEMAQGISDAVEALGFSYRWGGRKRYIWGKLPVADVFLAWARAQRTDMQVVALRAPKHVTQGSKLKFHLVSLGLILSLLAWRFRKRIRQNIGARRSQPAPLN